MPISSTEHNVLFWVCADCGFTVIGDEYKAHEHHSEIKNDGHWLYEFCANSQESPYPFRATGREIHTSDLGGFYLQPNHEPNDVMIRFAQAFLNPLVNKTFKS